MPFCSSATNFNATHKVSKLHRAPSFVHEFSTGIKNADILTCCLQYRRQTSHGWPDLTHHQHFIRAAQPTELFWMNGKLLEYGIFAENLKQNEELLNEEDPGDCSVPYGSDGSSGVRLSSPRQFPAPSGVDYHAPLLSCWMPRALSVLAGKLGWKDTEFNPQAIVVTPL